MRGQARHLLALASGRSFFYSKAALQTLGLGNLTFLLFRLFIPSRSIAAQKQVSCPPWPLWRRLLLLHLHLLQHLQALIILNITRPPPPPRQVHLQNNKVSSTHTHHPNFPSIVFIPTSPYLQ